jgi:spermidine/putrescine transport system substrate-binding protein
MVGQAPGGGKFRLHNPRPIDVARLENYGNIHPRARNIPEFTHEGKHYVVPFTQVLYSMFYNHKRIASPPDSWRACWDRQYAGKIIMNDRARQTIAIASLVLGDDPNDPKMWDETRRLLLDQKKLIFKYWTDHQATMEMLVREQAWIGMFTDGRVRKAAEMGAPVTVHIPEEGAGYVMDTFAIPVTAKNPDAAHAFIDFMHKPEIATKVMTILYYDSLNEKARTLLPQDLQKSFDLPNSEKLVLLNDVSPALKRTLDELWLAVKLG